MLDDLRKSALEGEADFDFDDDDFMAGRDERQERLFLGMRPVERMMLSIFLFMNVCIIMLALLLATRRIVF